MFRVKERGSGPNGHYQIAKADVDSFFSNFAMKNEEFLNGLHGY